METRVYFSGAHGSVGDETNYHQHSGWNGRCFSFEYWNDKRTRAAFDYCKDNGVAVMFDSGAYSLQKKGARVTWKDHDAYLERYAAVLETIRPHLAFYLALDFRRKGFATTESCRRMRRLGFDEPVPTYHGNDDFAVLEELCADYPLVAIAQPRSPGSAGPPLLRYYDKCFEIGLKYGTRFHGLSQTGRPMFLYPWSSVDSTSWLVDGSRLHQTISFDENGRKTKTSAPELTYQECCAHNARESVRTVRDIGSRLHRPSELRAQSETEADQDLAERIASAPRNDLRLHRFRLKAIDTLGDHRGQFDPKTGEQALYLRAVLLRQLHWGEKRVEIPGDELRRELRAFQARYLPMLPPGLMTKVIVNSERMARSSPRFTNPWLIETLRITPQEQRLIWSHTRNEVAA